MISKKNISKILTLLEESVDKEKLKEEYENDLYSVINYDTGKVLKTGIPSQLRLWWAQMLKQNKKIGNYILRPLKNGGFGIFDIDTQDTYIKGSEEECLKWFGQLMKYGTHIGDYIMVKSKLG